MVCILWVPLFFMVSQNHVLQCPESIQNSPKHTQKCLIDMYTPFMSIAHGLRLADWPSKPSISLDSWPAAGVPPPPLPTPLSPVQPVQPVQLVWPRFHDFSHILPRPVLRHGDMPNRHAIDLFSIVLPLRPYTELAAWLKPTIRMNATGHA